MVLTPPKLNILISFPQRDLELKKLPKGGWQWADETRVCHTIVEAIRWAWHLWPGCLVLETDAEGHFVKNGPWVTGAARALTGRF